MPVSVNVDFLDKCLCCTVPVAARSKAWVCDRSQAGISGSNPSGEICLLYVFCFVIHNALRWDDHSSRGVLSSAVCLSMIVNPRHWGGL